MTEPLFHRHLQHHFFHQFGVAIHGQEGFVGIVGPNHHKVAVADNGVQAEFVGVAGSVSPLYKPTFLM